MSEAGWVLFQSVYLDSGWARILPNAAIEPAQIAVRLQGATLEQFHAELAGSPHSAEGLASDAWEPLHQYTDDELAELDEHFEGTPFASSDEERQRTAAQVMAHEAQLRVAEVAEMDRFAAHLSVAPVRTFRDLIEFMTAAGVLRLNGGTYELNPSALLPEEVLPLSDDVRHREESLRWQRLHEETEYAIIELFRPHELAPADRIATTLSQLANELARPVESVREACAQLVAAPDFSTTHDMLVIGVDEPFTMSVDWEIFFATRISVRTGISDDR
ncbi:DUF6042 family protein (plasmid) [Herbiconiux sp. KACC 21604]|uniref:DUF6042 family protein n=1 Tax=unclassified Herbiconiux TaxID=2618217 RepID=UPI001492DF50|nr:MULTISPECIES: DUF6042 family protein [unclassified Herbiconiux]QJU56258.1 hypothetical protein HL652_20975 [Herbiconiux sp. SALV-R1]WPO88872.1 DUF6042 family protein [Herbiconiux sp. KACC 21604]